MPHVRCQVQVRGKAVRLLWSERTRSFPPCQYEGAQAVRMNQLAEQAWTWVRQHAAVGPGSPSAHYREVARIGHELFQCLLGDLAPAPAADISAWLRQQQAQGRLYSLEILGDYEWFPWNLLYDAPPETQPWEADRDAAWQPFWGRRLALTTGRQAGPLRGVREWAEPRLLLALDPVVYAQLPLEQQERLQYLAQRQGVSWQTTAAGVQQALKSEGGDLLYLLGRADHRGLWLGDQCLTVQVLEQGLRTAEEHDWPGTGRLLLVTACPYGESEGWHTAVRQLHRLGLGGLIVSEAPLPAEVGNEFALQFLEKWLTGNQPLGPLVQQLRQRLGTPALLYTVACPPWLQVAPAEESAGPPPAEPLTPAIVEPWPEPPTRPLPETPYRPLRPYEREDRALFVGRDKDTLRAAGLLDAPGVRLLVLHGRAAVGKSSLVRAGLLPFLEEEGVGYEALRDRQEDSASPPILAVRTTSDPAGQLAGALAAACARPWTYTTPLGQSVTVDAAAQVRQVLARTGREPVAPESETWVEHLETGLRSRPALVGELLTALAEQLPSEPVLVLEQGEEVFTLPPLDGVPPAASWLGAALRSVLQQSGAGKLILILRTEYLGQLLDLLGAEAASAALRLYHLPELDRPSLLAAIVQPTSIAVPAYSNAAPWEKYRFTYDEEVPPSLVDRVIQEMEALGSSPLLLLQLACDRLLSLALSREEARVRIHDLRMLDLERLLPDYVEEHLQQLHLSRRERRQLAALLAQLCRPQADGTVVRDLAPLDELAAAWRGASSLERILERSSQLQPPLVEVCWLGCSGQERPFVSLSSDALALGLLQSQRHAWQRREQQRRTQRDWLWLVIPLGILLFVLAWSWWQTRGRLHSYRQELAKVAAQQSTQERLLKQVEQSARFHALVHHLRLAEQAWAQGDVLRCRQLLLNHRRSPRSHDDPRGFAWYHLWQLLDQSQTTLLGHEGPLTGLALSPDGQRLASVASDGALRLWRLAPVEVQESFPLSEGVPLTAVAWGASEQIACASSAGPVYLFDLAVERMRRPAVRHTLLFKEGAIRALAFTADGQTLALAEAAGKVSLYDPQTASHRRTLTGPTGPVQALAFAPGGQFLAAGASDHNVYLWNPHTGELLHVWRGHSGPVQALAVAPDGRLLAAGSSSGKGKKASGQVKFWDFSSNQEDKRFLAVPTAVQALAFLGDSQTLLVGGRDGAVRQWDLKGLQERAIFRGHVGRIQGLAVLPGQRRFVSAAADSTLKVWSLDEPPARQVLSAHPGPAQALALDPQGEFLVSGGQDGNIHIWEVAKGVRRRTLTGSPGPVTALALARRQGQPMLVSAHAPAKEDSDNLLVWDLQSGQIQHRLSGHQGAVLSLALPADGELLVSGGAEGEVRVWDLARGVLRHRFRGHAAPVVCLTYSSATGYAASGDASGVIHLADARAAAPGVSRGLDLFSDRHAGAVRGLFFLKDNQLLSLGEEGEIKQWQWEATRGQLLGSWPSGLTELRAAAFDPADLELALGGASAGVALWSWSAQQVVHTLPGPPVLLRALAFSPEGRLLAAVADDGKLYLWRAAPREPLPQAAAPEEEP
jgi:WD40 repeat protein